MVHREMGEYRERNLMTEIEIKRLVIDDCRVFEFKADYCRTTDAFRNMFEYSEDAPHYDEVWLDNDMGQGPFNNVEYLVDEIIELAKEGNLLPIDKFIVHTGNGRAGKAMVKALRKFYPVQREYDPENFMSGIQMESGNIISFAQIKANRMKVQ